MARVQTLKLTQFPLRLRLPARQPVGRRQAVVEFGLTRLMRLRLPQRR